MWHLRKIFGSESDPLTRTVGTAALVLLFFGVLNVAREGVPTVPLLIYRGGIIITGMCLFFWTMHLVQNRK